MKNKKGQQITGAEQKSCQYTSIVIRKIKNE